MHVWFDIFFLSKTISMIFILNQYIFLKYYNLGHVPDIDILDSSRAQFCTTLHSQSTYTPLPIYSIFVFAHLALACTTPKCTGRSPFRAVFFSFYLLSSKKLGSGLQIWLISGPIRWLIDMHFKVGNRYRYKTFSLNILGRYVCNSLNRNI